MEFGTETEQWLYEERKQMKVERDKAIKELEDYKDSIEAKAQFSVYMYSLVPDNSTGIIWGHSTDGATMVIKKNDVSITLSPEEIKQVVKSAGGNFRR